jgi:YesN/AraC family two-component response regulator
MSERLKAKIGDELYNKILEQGVKSTELDLVDGWIPRARFNEISDKLKTTSEKVTSYEKQIQETTNLLKGSEELKGQYDSLQSKYTQELQMKDKEIANITKATAVREALIKEGGKHLDLLMKTVNLDNVTMTDGNINGLTDVVKELKKEYGDLFSEKVKTTTTTTPGSSSSSDDEPDWESIAKNLI